MQRSYPANLHLKVGSGELSVSDVNEARKAFEREVQRITGKPGYQLTERLIDLIREVRDELRRTTKDR